MRIAAVPRACSACLILIACVSTGAISQPRPVPRIVDEALDKASYVALAKEWRAYMDKHGETADGLVNLGMAQNYSGELEAAKRAGKRAVELEPENPRALTFYAGLLSTSEEGLAEALKLLEHCRNVAPDYGNALTTLLATHLKSGALRKARDVSRTIFDRKIFSRPLQDFAYNMLIGLPEGAVLVTNGDSDTFVPLALQAGMDLRPDAIVVNRHLLHMAAYYDAIIREHPALKPAGSWKPDAAPNASRSILEKWIADAKVPLHFAVTVAMGDLGFDPQTTIEGLSLRVTGKGLTSEEAARLVLERYRLDSATDWDFPWDLTPGISTLIAHNYAASFAGLSQRDGVPHELKCRLLGMAAEIAKFHDSSIQAHVETLLKQCEEK